MESALAALPDVAQATVIAQRASSGEHRLIGHAVAASGAEVSALEMRDGWRKRCRSTASRPPYGSSTHSH
ncbi:hypothetical protein ACFWBS_57070 [Streptomyces mirabilis]|uniref:hypothetical protein n=1 Tax=Streptomyces mirabilis TaxID=68239 RepID=UPI003662B1C2